VEKNQIVTNVTNWVLFLVFKTYLNDPILVNYVILPWDQFLKVKL